MRLDFQNRLLPEGWVTDHIGHRVKLNYGKSQSAVREIEGKVPIYGTGGLIEHGSAALCSGNSVLIGRKGTLGNPLYIEHPFWPVDTTYYTSDFDGCTKWFFYLVQTLGLEKLNEATGVPSLSRETFNRLEVPFPPKPEQEKIAEILTTVDRAIEQTESLIAKYQHIKTGLMQDLLTRGIDEHGRLRDPATHKFKPSPLGNIPIEWHVATLSELLANVPNSFRSGPFGSALRKEQLKDSGIPFLGIDNVHVERFVPHYTRFVDEDTFVRFRRYAVRPRDVMVTIMGTVGRCCVIPDEIGTALGSKHVWAITLDQNKASSAIVCWQLNYAPWVLQRFTKDEQGGIMTAIRSDTLRALLLPVPPRNEQEAIGSIYFDLNGLLIREQDLLRKLERLKTGLMQDLLTGKVSVEPLLAAD